MKTWNITITAINEKEAYKLSKVMSEAFKISVKFNEPLDHIYATLKGVPPAGKIECDVIKTIKK